MWQERFECSSNSSRHATAVACGGYGDDDDEEDCGGGGDYGEMSSKNNQNAYRICTHGCWGGGAEEQAVLGVMMMIMPTIVLKIIS